MGATRGRERVEVTYAGMEMEESQYDEKRWVLLLAGRRHLEPKALRLRSDPQVSLGLASRLRNKAP